MRRKADVIDKPWGKEEIWTQTPHYLGKMLYIHNGHRLSRQFHENKVETIQVLMGTLTLEIGEGSEMVSHRLGYGDCFHIPAGTVHRMCAYDGNVKLVEVSTFHPNDVVRLEDDYAR